MTRLVLSGYALALAGSIAAQSPAQRSVLVASETPLRCKLKSSGTSVDALGGRALLVDCARPAEVLSCDGETTEPIDMSVADACRFGAIRPVPGRLAVLKAPDSSAPFEVELVESSSEAPFVRVLARRALEVGMSDLPIRIAGTSRYLRIWQAGASPLTVPVTDEMFSLGGWPLPAPVGGGELVLASPSVLIFPESFNVTSDVAASFRLPAARLSARAGLLPGRYSVTPVYEGGLEGPTLTATVEAGQSAIAAVRPGPVGSLAVSIAADLCPGTTGLRVSLRQDDGTSNVVARLRDWLEPGRCEWRIAGLPPGHFLVGALAMDGVVASGEAEVADQRVASLVLARPQTVVTGQVSLNGRALADEPIRFVPRPGSRSDAIVVMTDVAGTYRAELPKPGDYSVGVGSPEWRTDARGTFVEGQNTFDMPLTGGAITVRVQGWDHQTSTVITAVGPTSNNATLRAGGQLPVALRGLAFGTYLVSASQPLGLVVREAKSVVIDKDHPDARVDLELIENSARITVRDASGALVEGAEVRWGAARLPQDSPGVIKASGASPGSPLFVMAPSFVPTCVIATLADREVVLDRGAPALIQLPSDIRRPGGYIVGLRGAECPVALNLFDMTDAGPGPEGQLRFAIRSFPLAGDVLWEPPGSQSSSRRRVIREGGVLVIQEKQ